MMQKYTFFEKKYFGFLNVILENQLMMKVRIVFALLFFAVFQCAAHSVVRDGDYYVVSHEWKYRDLQWNCSLSFPVDLYRYYQGRNHMSDDMVQYVLSDYDREYVRGLVASFRDGGERAGYSSDDNMHNVISFVQSLQYVTDIESKGQKDYIRFPLETLVDGEGDCEDLAILAAAILHEMGYRVLLVMLPEHLSLAVDCGADINGTYYTYNGSRYYYLEVTNTGWDIGQIPDVYKNCKATLVPLVYQPHMRLLHCGYRHDYYYSTDREVPFVLECELENPGPGSTEGLSIRVLFKTQGGRTVVDRNYPLNNLSEGESFIYELTVDVPRPFTGILEVHAEGLNFDSESLRFDDVELQ